MQPRYSHRFLVLLCLCLLQAFASRSSAQDYEQKLPGKKLLRIGSELVSRMLDSASIADADLPSRVPTWQNTGLDGLVFNIASDHSAISGSTRLMNGQWWNVHPSITRTYAELIPDIQAFQSVTDWGRLTDNFLWSSYAVWDTPSYVKTQDWFSDADWATIINNVTIQARVALECGFTGVLLDVEQYEHHGGGAWRFPFDYDYYSSYASSPQSFQQCYDKIEQRGQQYAQALCSEYPGLTLIIIPAFYRPGGMLPTELLYPAFIDGVLAGLDPCATLVSGIEVTYGLMAYSEIDTIYDGVISQHIARSQTPQLVQDKLTAMVGINVDDPVAQFTPEEYERAIRNALAVSAQYAFSYGEPSNFLAVPPSPETLPYLQANIDAHNPPASDPYAGSVYDESFVEGIFDDTQSAFANETGSVGSPGDCAYIDVAEEALEITNVTNNDGWLLATLDTPVSGGSEIVIESVVSVTQGGSLSHHAYIMQPRMATDEAIALTIKACEVDTTHWDLDIWNTDYAEGSVQPGLSLNKAAPGQTIYYTVSQHILPGATHAVVSVNDVPVGTYACQRPGNDLLSVRVGNGHPDYGFYNALISDVRIGNPICGSSGTVYLQSDLTKDCRVNLLDFALIAGEWLYCTDPADSNCDQYLPLAVPQ